MTLFPTVTPKWPNWRGQSFFYAPMGQAIPERAERKPRSVNPPLESLSDASVLNDAAGPSVVGLNRGRGPAAVPRSVGAGVVYAVDARACRPRTHVAKERGEVLAPLGADGNTAATVPSIGLVSAVVAPTPKGHPDAMLGGPGAPMRGTPRGRQLGAQAATTAGVPVLEGLSDCRDGVAALAAAKPAVRLAKPRLMRRSTDHSESSEGAARQFNHFGHTNNMVLHR